MGVGVFVSMCCILLNFYIKPQPVITKIRSTSSCILLNFYIKPQLSSVRSEKKTVVSY